MDGAENVHHNLLFSCFLLFGRWRIIVGGRGILKESVNDVAPYVLGDMSSEQEFRVEV